jgi:hypothetical protein
VIALAVIMFRSESEADTCIIGDSRISDDEEWRVIGEVYWPKATSMTRAATGTPVSLRLYQNIILTKRIIFRQLF